MTAEQMWHAYCESSGVSEQTPYSAWAFCGGGAAGDELAHLVLAGTKTATASALLAFELEQDPLPNVGEYSVILFSGGEPLIRPDFFTLAEHAAKMGVRPTLSTNGTLITPEVAKKIKDIGIGYVGISLDGLREVNDTFRGVEGAFDLAMQGIRNCRATMALLGGVRMQHECEGAPAYQIFESEY